MSQPRCRSCGAVVSLGELDGPDLPVCDVQSMVGLLCSTCHRMHQSVSLQAPLTKKKVTQWPVGERSQPDAASPLNQKGRN